MNYQKAQDYLNSFINYERLTLYPYRTHFKLQREKRLLHFLKNPHLNLSVIHVAGTKGKGSTCAFIASILEEAGYKVGLYTSPHLHDVRERIVILKGKAKTYIPEDEFSALIKKIRPFAEKLRTSRLGNLSYYEVLTALAFLYFKNERCDFVVLETGIGGRLDATNVCRSRVCAITPISYEHVEVLGSTLTKIAKEKSAIIKRCARAVISAPQRPVVLKILRKKTHSSKAQLVCVGKDVRFALRSASEKHQSFDLVTENTRYSNIRIELLGIHQLVNAAVAVAAVEALKCDGIKLSIGCVKRGLARTHWPGRLQVVSNRPRIVIDGAQNRASAHALKSALKQHFTFKRLILLFGASKDKDIKGMLDELTPIADEIILTKSVNPRAACPDMMQKYVAQVRRVTLINNLPRALERARKIARTNDIIIVTGSLFLVGEILKGKYERLFQ